MTDQGTTDREVRKDLLMLWAAVNVIVTIVGSGIVLASVSDPSVTIAVLAWALVDANAIAWVLHTNKLPRKDRLRLILGVLRVASSVVAAFVAAWATCTLVENPGWGKVLGVEAALARMGLVAVMLTYTRRPVSEGRLGFLSWGRKHVAPLVLAGVFLVGTAGPATASVMARASLNGPIVDAPPTTTSTAGAVSPTTTTPSQRPDEAPPAEPVTVDPDYAG